MYKIIKIGNGNLIISGYDTQEDLDRVTCDIERLLEMLAEESITGLIRIFEPYRENVAKAIDSGTCKCQHNCCYCREKET